MPVVVAAALVAAQAFAQAPARLALDSGFEGPAAPYFLAIDKGYYKAEGLDVSVESGSGPAQAIDRVASGTHPFGSADINALVRFRDRPENPKVTAILMIQNAPAFAVVTLKKTNIRSPKDLEGRVLGAPAADGAFAHWRAFVQANRIDASKVRIENVGFPEREPMLAQGRVDAITGVSYSSFMRLKALGIPADEIVVMAMRAHGLELYGNAVLVNPDFAKANPKLVRGFVRATIRGFRDAAQDPAAAVESLIKRDIAASEAVELERLQLALRWSIVTDEVRKNGFGSVDFARLARSLDQIGIAFRFTHRPRLPEVFTEEFLPALAGRRFD